jgi:hypothetical protein
MQLPNHLPILAAGKQPAGSGKVCSEQAVSWLVSGRLDLGDETDHPPCVQPVLNALAIHINDKLPDDRRGEMWPLILRQPGTAHPEMELVLSVRLAAFLAEWALDLSLPNDSLFARNAVKAARAWCDNPNNAYAADAAAYAVSAAAYAATYDATYDAAAHAAYAAAYAAYAAADAAYAAHAVYAAADAAHDSDRLLDLLAKAQDECERLTGHVSAEPDMERIELLGCLVGVR